MARKISVEIVGDSRSLERALDRSAKAATSFNRTVTKSSTDTAASFRPLLADIQRLQGELAKSEGDLATIEADRQQRLGGMARAATIAAGGVFALSRVFTGLGEGIAEAQGEESDFTQGLKNMGGAMGNLLTFDLAGLFKDLNQETKISTAQADQFVQRLAIVDEAARFAAAGMDEEAAAIADATAKQLAFINAIRGMEFAQRTFNVAIVDGVQALVEYKGAVDDLAGPRGPGARIFETPFRREGMPTLPPLSPSQRRELELIGAQELERLPLLRDRLQQLNGQMADFNGNQQQRLTIVTRIANTEREIATVLEAEAARQASAARAAAALAKQREAERQRRAREAREAAARALQQRQFRAIGLGPGGEEVIPGAANLRKQLTQLDVRRDEIPRKLRVRLAGVRRALRGEFGKLTDDTRAAIHDLFRAMRDSFDEESRDPLAGLVQVSTRRLAAQLAAGTGLAGAGRRALAFNVSGAQFQSYTTVKLDSRVVGQAVTTQQARTGKRTSNQTSGRRG